MNITNLDGIPIKIKWKIHVFWYIVFPFLKLLLIRVVTSYEIKDRASQPVPLFLVVLHHISFYISRYYFLQLFRTKSKIFWKKDFCHRFSVFNRFILAPKHLKSQNLSSMTKVFLLWLPKFGKFMVLYLGCGFTS